MADKSAELFLWLEWVILDFFLKMAASENEGIYFVSYLLIHMKYFNGSGI